jgi:cell division protein FtsI (penicillin-binding protein 3)
MTQRFIRLGWRQLTLLSGMILFALLITQNLAYYQVTKHADLARQAQQTYDQTIPVSAPRGEILDSKGVPLVMSAQVNKLHVDPKALNPKGLPAVTLRDARELAPILGQDVVTLTRELTYRGANVPGANYVLIADGLSDDTANAINALNLGQGIILEARPRAFYPNGALAAPLLGFVSKNGYGQYGIEQAYDQVLRGQDGTRLNLTNASTRPQTVRPRPFVPGADVVLTINETIQQIVEKRLTEIISRTHALGAEAIVMDPKTGAIMAMASLPSYDPNNYGLVTDPTRFNNRAIQNYQPGSTFKVISVATGFDAGAFNPTTIVNDPGIFQSPAYGDVPIHNWEPVGWGNETPEIMLRHSANVGMVQFAAMVQPPQKYYNYLINNFGFDQPTGINLPGEDTGIVRQPIGGHWQSLDQLTNSYGQSIDVTPLQLVTAMGALANGGKRMRPYVVQRVEYQGGRVVATQPKVVAQAVKPSTAATMTTVLHRAGLSQDLVDGNPYGASEATCALTQGFPIAAKTGTSTVDIVKSGAQDVAAGTVASLLGYAPIDDPKFVMLVTVDHPRRLPGDTAGGSHIYGAITAAPVWHDIAESLYRYLDIAPRPEPLVKTDPALGNENIPLFQGPQGWGCEFAKPNQP